MRFCPTCGSQVPQPPCPLCGWHPEPPPKLSHLFFGDQVVTVCWVQVAGVPIGEMVSRRELLAWWQSHER